MLSSKDVLKKYDLSSVRLLFTGAAPLGKETAEEMLKLYPTWHIGQGYGTCYFDAYMMAELLTYDRPDRVLHRCLLNK